MPEPLPHATLVKFGYPRTLLHEGRHWALLVRPSQPTLGSLVLCARAPVTSYAALEAAAFAEQGAMVAMIEPFLRRFSDPSRINYLMLMMVDPHVHFHVLPRYDGKRTHDGIDYPDRGWPALPDLANALTVSDSLLDAMRREWRMLHQR